MVPPAAPPDAATPNYIFQDEFDGPAGSGPDPSKWLVVDWDTPVTPPIEGHYTSRNVFTDGNSNLVTPARRSWLDPSPGMLAIARAEARAARARRPRLARRRRRAAAAAANCEIDAATIAFGIRNVPDRARALRELARVVRPGGRIAVLELGEPRRGVLGARGAACTRATIVPRLGALLSGAREYRYLQTLGRGVSAGRRVRGADASVRAST